MITREELRKTTLMQSSMESALSIAKTLEHKESRDSWVNRLSELILMAESEQNSLQDEYEDKGSW